MSEKPGSLGKQVGGNHYKGLNMEPYQFAMHNDWDPLAFTILKRIARYKNKDGVVDLEKAIHEVAIRKDLYNMNCYPMTKHVNRIPMDKFCEANGIMGEERAALKALEDWVYHPSDDFHPQMLEGWLIHFRATYTFDQATAADKADPDPAGT